MNEVKVRTMIVKRLLDEYKEERKSLNSKIIDLQIELKDLHRFGKEVPSTKAGVAL